MMKEKMDIEEAMLREMDYYLNQYDGQVFNIVIRNKIQLGLIEINEKYFNIRVQKILKKAIKEALDIDMPEIKI